MEFNILNILYLSLTIFTIILGSLLTVIFYKLIKVLNALMEIVEIYNSVKSILSLYSQIPEMALGYIKNLFFKKK